MKTYVDPRKSSSLTAVIAFCGPLILILVWTVRALLMHDSKTSRRPGCSGSKEAVSSRLARLTMLYSTGGRAGTDRMLERVWGFTSWRTRRRTEITL